MSQFFRFFSPTSLVIIMKSACDYIWRPKRLKNDLVIKKLTHYRVMLDTQNLSNRGSFSRCIVTLGKKRLVTNKTFGFFLDFSTWEAVTPQKTSVLDSVSCGDETPTAMHDRTRLRKLFGTIQSRDLFPVDVSRPPRWKKSYHVFLPSWKFFFSHHRSLAVQKDGRIVRFFPIPTLPFNIVPLFLMTELWLHALVTSNFITMLSRPLDVFFNV